ncbi:hypothetical protein ACFLZ6_01530, partial [Nanoarchaeota archaeon]
MNYKKLIASTLIQLIILMPIYSAMVFAQPAAQSIDLDVDVPRYHNKRVIDIAGTVTPSLTVQLYIDNNLERVLPSSETDDGNFEFSNINLGSHGITRTITVSATDGTGNINKQDFLVTVDEESPKINIKSFPDFSSKSGIKITGSVEEEVTINVRAMTSTPDLKKPNKIIGLKNNSVLPNLVELGWHKANETDFDRYIVYRDDVGAIATTNPASYTSYTDVLVNSDQAYSYSVAAMDLAGNVGAKSDSLKVTTLAGGRTDIKKPSPIDPSKDRGLKKTITVNGDFSIDLDLGDDGTYDITLEAVDGAGNIATLKNKTIIDTKPPEFEEVNPRTSTRIYETYAKEVDIQGKTKPLTKVKIYLNEAGGVEDFSTISDSNGNFRFDDIDITSKFRGSIVPQRVDVGDLDSRYNIIEDEAGRYARSVTLYFVAEDRFGRKAETNVVYNIVTCWEGQFDWDAMPILEHQSPTWLSVERLAEGTESIYFFFNFTYLGQGREAKIESVNFRKACDDYIEKDPRYNVSCDVLPNACTAKGNDDNTMWYIACDLKQYEGFNDFLEEDWQGFFSSINNEMIFPFRTTIRYSHIIGNNRSIETQAFCEPVTYVVDSSKVDFREVLPDWMLYDLVDSLNSTISTLNTWQESIEDVLEYLGVGCVIGWGLRTIATIYRRFVCYWEGFQESLEEFGKKFKQQQEAGETKEDEKPCPKDEKGQNKLSDADLATDCTQCSGAWEFEEKLYFAYRTLCDRVFCHDSPARWTQNQGDSVLYEQSIKEVSQCGDDDRGVKGQTIRQVECSKWEGALDKGTLDRNSAGDECYQARVLVRNIPDYIVFVKEKNSEQDGTGIFHFTSVSLTAPRAAVKPDVNFYAKKVKGSLKDVYSTSDTKSCEDVCGKSDTTQPMCITSKQCLALDAPEKSDDKINTI